MKNSTDAYSATSVRVFFTIFYGVLSVGGVFGNILVILVVVRVRNMLTPTNCYLISLAVSDCVFFMTAVTVELAYLHLPAAVFPFPLIGCRMLTYLPYLTINASSLSITAFTIERFIGICHPMKARYLCTVRRASFIIIGIWIFSILYNSPWLFLATLKPINYSDLNASTCTFTIDRQSPSYKIIFLADFLLFYLLPLMLYLYLYGKIAFTLTMTEFQGVEEKRSADISSPDSAHVRHRRNTFVSGQQATTKRHQAVKMLVVIVLIFAFCWLPYRGLVLYNSFASKPWTSIAFIYFAKVMIFVNCSINPVLYNLMSSRFKIAFSLFLKYGCTNSKLAASATLLQSLSTPISTTFLTKTSLLNRPRYRSMLVRKKPSSLPSLPPRSNSNSSLLGVKMKPKNRTKNGLLKKASTLSSVPEQTIRHINPLDDVGFLRIIIETPCTEL